MNKQIIEKKLKDVLTMTKIKNQNLWADILKKETSRFTKWSLFHHLLYCKLVKLFKKQME
jgi:hypothetical protein